MNDLPPNWAIERALALADEPYAPTVVEISSSPNAYRGYVVFARYIAAHEDAPATPRDLIAEAVTVGDAYAAADRALKLLSEAGFAVVAKEMVL